MTNLSFSADAGFDNGTYHVGLSLIEFKEEDVTVIYSPAFDLSGYGYSRKEALESFNVAFHEFMTYTHNKHTLNKVLLKLGWQLKGSKKKPKFNPPKDTDLIAKNKAYSEIVNNKDYKVSRGEVELAY